MNTTRPVRLLALAVLAGGAFIACGAEPKLQVQVAEATPAATQANVPSGGAPQLPASHPPLDASPQPAPALEPGAAMPAGHPPLDAPVQQAPPLEPGAQLPANHPPMGAMGQAGSMPPGGMGGTMALAPVDPTLGSGDKAIAWEVPAGWASVPPSSTMRRAQYKVPGKGGDAECAVFYFGPGQGGDPQSNAERWASQFLGADGQPGSAKMTTRQIESNGVKILFVETRGSYMAGAMAGGSSAVVPGQALLGAIAEGPDANWFFKMTGPEATVDAQRAAFEGMLKSLKKGE